MANGIRGEGSEGSDPESTLDNTKQRGDRSL